jgi:catechol 2,3-dioxygenase-like lactoylglutathione lyase family enzyme
MTSPAHTPPIHDMDHLTFPVADLEQAEAFYVGILGGQLLRRVDRTTFLRMRPERAAEADADNSPLHIAVRIGDGPELHLFLQRTLKRQPPRPHPHLAFRVDHDELDVFRAQLVAAGVTLDGPRQLGGPGQASLYFTDPWGQLLELATTNYRGAVLYGPPDLKCFA